jgi:hypothetical protein
LFAAIQSKERQFLKETVLTSQDDIVVKDTGEQLNKAISTSGKPSCTWRVINPWGRRLASQLTAF